MIDTNDYKFSSNVIEIIWPFLNFFFFYQNILHTTKAQNTLCKTQNKKYTQKTSKRLLGQFQTFYKMILHTPKAQNRFTPNKKLKIRTKNI